MTRFGIIGAGHIGRNFSIAAIAAGHEVVISNSQGPETLTGLVAELGPKAAAATAVDAATAGEMVLVAIPLAATDEVPVDPLAGKVVMDTCNYHPQRGGRIAELDSGTITVTGLLQRHLPTSRVVKAFNGISAAQIASDGAPAGSPGRRALGLAGDDEQAKRAVADVYDQLGFDAVDVGGLEESWRLDADQPTFVVRQNAEQLRANADRARRHVRT
jgi:8-hydroxy-5-deazaflavin:NADPH oxidoreductase